MANGHCLDGPKSFRSALLNNVEPFRVTVANLFRSVYIYIYIYTQIHSSAAASPHTRLYIYIYIYSFICVFVYLFIYTHTHTHYILHVCMYIYIYMYIHTYTYIHIHTYIYMYIYIYIYTHIHCYLPIYLLQTVIYSAPLRVAAFPPAFPLAGAPPGEPVPRRPASASNFAICLLLEIPLRGFPSKTKFSEDCIIFKNNTSDCSKDFI